MKRKMELYEYSLWQLFWKSGLTGFMIFAFAEIIILFVCLYNGYNSKDIVFLLKFMNVFALVVFYARPLFCLFQVIKQQSVTGIYWKNRNDFHREEDQREWFVRFDGGGFILYHKSYIGKILRTIKEDVMDGDGYARGTCYILNFEDITGKQRKIKFCDRIYEVEFRKWFGKKKK